MARPIFSETRIKQVYHWLKENYPDTLAGEEERARRVRAWNPREPLPEDLEGEDQANFIANEIRRHRDRFKFLNHVPDVSLNVEIFWLYDDLSVFIYNTQK